MGKKFIFMSKSSTEKKNYRLSYSYYNDDELKELFNPKYHKYINDLNEDHNKVFNSRFKGDLINQMCNTDIEYFMNGLNLTYTDRASMFASVEVRVPFIDKDVITSAMTIKSKFKFKYGQSKYILKKVAEKYLPKKLIYRRKASFGAPIRSWISGELSAMVDELLSETNINKRNIFNYEKIKLLIENDRKGIEDNAYRIYQLLTLELWLREYLD